ncbi:CHAT domain-containing protein [Hyaloscypha finlandica]|nr:CHAT domain-containing protein [Hyaloscypha finlandica]
MNGTAENARSQAIAEWTNILGKRISPESSCISLDKLIVACYCFILFAVTEDAQLVFGETHRYINETTVVKLAKALLDRGQARLAVLLLENAGPSNVEDLFQLLKTIVIKTPQPNIEAHIYLAKIWCSLEPSNDEDFYGALDDIESLVSQIGHATGCTDIAVIRIIFQSQSDQQPLDTLISDIRAQAHNYNKDGCKKQELEVLYSALDLIFEHLPANKLLIAQILSEIEVVEDVVGDKWLASSQRLRYLISLHLMHPDAFERSIHFAKLFLSSKTTLQIPYFQYWFHSILAIEGARGGNASTAICSSRALYEILKKCGSSGEALVTAERLADALTMEFRGDYEGKKRRLALAEDVLSEVYTKNEGGSCVEDKTDLVYKLARLQLQKMNLEVNMSPIPTFRPGRGDLLPVSLFSILQRAENLFIDAYSRSRILPRGQQEKINYRLDLLRKRMEEYKDSDEHAKDNTPAVYSGLLGELKEVNESLTWRLETAHREGSFAKLKTAIGDVISHQENAETSYERYFSHLQYYMALLLSMSMGRPEERRIFWDSLGIQPEGDANAGVMRACLETLARADYQWTNLRRENFQCSGAEAQKLPIVMAAQHFAARHSIYVDMGLSLSLELEDAKLSWNWLQLKKARVVADFIYLNSSFPADEGEESTSLAGAGKPMSFDDLCWVQSFFQRRLVFVEWVAYEQSFTLFLSYFDQKTDEARVIIHRNLGVTRIEVADWKRNHLKIQTLYDKEAEEIFKEIESLVAPLGSETSSEDFLVFCPTAPLHNIPIHALSTLDCQGKRRVLLLERNTIMHSPSISIFRNCLRRAVHKSSGIARRLSSSILGAYDDDVEESKEVKKCLYELANRFVKEVDLVHFHGHVNTKSGSSLDHSLQLGWNSSAGAYQDIKASSIAGLIMNAPSPHFTVIGCGGAIQDFNLIGDEPLGLVPALILAGASSIVSTLWDIESSNGRAFTRSFYHGVKPEGMMVGQEFEVAEAVRRAALALREGQRPMYHWASFVCVGLPTLRNNWQETLRHELHEQG